MHHLLHWVDAGGTDLENAALLCQRHHTFVHDRRVWATARSRPDELGRYVVWDLDLGSYDRQLEWLARQRAEHDPPPLTEARLLELVTAITKGDDTDRRLAQHDLDQHADAHHWAEVRTSTDDPAVRAWYRERAACC